jgi:glycosyltransferase involved in cell wall biosynthesis
MPDVTVAVTVLNEVNDIGRLVDSLMAQRFSPVEVVVVDGGSNDGTWEWLLEAAKRYPALRPIRDESANLKQTPGPIARGRNVGASAARSEIVACADAGCIYEPEWLERLTAAIRDGSAEYALGGSFIDMRDATAWDVASAPFFGVKLERDEPTKSCTARSMAFRKELWERVGGFPETVLLGEDTLFDQRVRAVTAPAFVQGAKAVYRPQHSFGSAIHQMASYAVADGALGVRPARLMRNLLRCVAEVAALAVLPWTRIPLLVVLALESYWAFRLDWKSVRSQPPGVLAKRFVFSLLVPWVVTWNQLRGAWTKRSMPNRQNV